MQLFLQVENSQDVRMTTHFLLVSWSGMCGAIPLLPLYAIMVSTGTTLPFTYNTIILIIYCFPEQILVFRYTAKQRYVKKT